MGYCLPCNVAWLTSFSMDSPLRTYRKERKLTLAEQAAKFGMTAGQLSRIERDNSTSLETALTIERLTGIKVGPLEGASSRDLRAVARVIGERAA